MSGMCPSCGLTSRCLFCLAEDQVFRDLARRKEQRMTPFFYLRRRLALIKALWWGITEGRHWVDDRHLR